MSSAEFSALHILHVTAALMLVGFVFYSFAADPARKRYTMIGAGIASLLLLLTGVRMWQGQFGFAPAGWIFVKIVCWLVLSAFAGIGFRRRRSPGTLVVITLLVAAIAVAMVYTKPF